MLSWSRIGPSQWVWLRGKGMVSRGEVQPCQPPQNSQLRSTALLRLGVPVDGAAGQSLHCAGTAASPSLKPLADKGVEAVCMRNNLHLPTLQLLGTFRGHSQTHSFRSRKSQTPEVSEWGAPARSVRDPGCHPACLRGFTATPPKAEGERGPALSLGTRVCLHPASGRLLSPALGLWSGQPFSLKLLQTLCLLGVFSKSCMLP